jgi:beta-carotene hydroxylase
MQESDIATLPSLAELGRDLTKLTPWQRWSAIALPFLFVPAFFLFAWLDWWPAAVLAVAGYTFFSYGSTSHDLVHGNLGLPRWLDRTLLSLVELLGMRSGHAYRVVHLYHHRRFPNADDIEGSAAHRSWYEALLAGPLQQSRNWWWALRHGRQDRGWILLEGIACGSLLVLAIMAWPITMAPLVYVALVVLGSWTFPFITSYLPHDPEGADELSRTRRFRGKVAGTLFWQHLYHLEHHLYPGVPHQHWRTLAKRLDPYLDRAGAKPIYFGF